MPTKHGNFTAEEKLETRRAEANERAAVRAQRGPIGQLKRLDSVFGKNVGAKKERARLTKVIADATKAPNSKKLKRGRA